MLTYSPAVVESLTWFIVELRNCAHSTLVQFNTHSGGGVDVQQAHDPCHCEDQWVWAGPEQGLEEVQLPLPSKLQELMKQEEKSENVQKKCGTMTMVLLSFFS